MSEMPVWFVGFAKVTLPEPVRTVDPRLFLRWDNLNRAHTVLAGWPARDALPTTDPEDC